jgi:polysaccharide chain length determinant protein (PEP-CTERM system associated)
MNPEPGLQIRDLAGVLRRRQGTIAVVAGAIFLVSIVTAALLPNRYEAWTTLLVEPQTISKGLIDSTVEESELEGRLHLMTMQILSRGRLSRVITDLELYPEESKEMTREEVISLMRSHIRVEPVLPELEVTDRRRQHDFEINTFRLHFRSESANTAAAVANRLANDFIDEHLKERVQVSGDTSEFIGAELERLSTRIGEVEARIAEVKDASPGRLPDDVDSNHRLLERSVDLIRNVQRDLAIAESDEAFYKQQVLAGGDSLTDHPNQMTPARKLELLELALAEYRGRGFTEKHPDMVATEQEIEEVKAKIESGAAEGEETGLSPAQQNARAEQQRASLRAASARQEIERVTAQIAQIQEHLTATPRVAEQLAALEREYEHLFQNYQDFSNKRLEAGVAANMERRQKGEQFRILESAFAPPEPFSPNRIAIIAVGLLLGIGLGAGVAVLLEALDSSFHGVHQLQAALRLPVLVSIPGIVLESDRLAMRRRRIRNAVAAAAVTCVVLAGAIAGNWAVNGVPGFVQTLIAGEEPAAPAAPAGEQG